MLGAAGCGVVALVRLRPERREGEVLDVLPPWVEQARQRGQARFEEHQVLASSPETNGALAPVFDGLWESRWDAPAPFSLAETLMIWTSDYCCWFTSKSLDFDRLVASNAEFAIAVRRLEKVLPALLDAFRRPAFEIQDLGMENEGRGLVWMRALHITLREYLRLLSFQERPEESVKLLTAMIHWSYQACETHNAIDRGLRLHLHRWSLEYLLTLLNPQQPWATPIWQEASELTQRYSPLNNQLVSYLEDDLARIVRWSKRHAEENRPGLLNRHVPQTSTFFDDLYHSAAWYLQKAMEPRPQLQNAVAKGSRHRTDDQPRGYLADSCPLNYAAYQGAALAYRILAHRAEHGEFPAFWEGLEPDLHYDLDTDGHARVTVDVPPNKFFKENRHFEGSWYGYREGRMHFELGGNP